MDTRTAWVSTAEKLFKIVLGETRISRKFRVVSAPAQQLCIKTGRFIHPYRVEQSHHVSCIAPLWRYTPQKRPYCTSLPCTKRGYCRSSCPQKGVALPSERCCAVHQLREINLGLTDRETKLAAYPNKTQHHCLETTLHRSPDIGVHALVDTEYDWAKVPLHNRNDPRPPLVLLNKAQSMGTQGV